MRNDTKANTRIMVTEEPIAIPAMAPWLIVWWDGGGAAAVRGS